MEEELDYTNRISRIERLTLRMSVIQTVIAVTGFFVAIIALYAALNESDAVRKQQQASVWPHLEFQQALRSVKGEEQLSIILKNTGIGPAKIESIEFSFNGTKLSNWDQFLNEFDKSEKRLFSYSNVLGRVIPPKESYELITLTAGEIRSETILAVRDAIAQDKLEGRVCYCSVFDDCWLLSSHSLEKHSLEKHSIKHCALSNVSAHGTDLGLG